MQAYDMWDEKLNAGERRMRTTQKPIAWQWKEEHAEEWANDVNHMMHEWTPSWKYDDLVNAMNHTKKYGTTRAQRRGRTRRNETTTEHRRRATRSQT